MMNNTLRQKNKEIDLNDLSLQAFLSLDNKKYKLGNKKEKEPILYFYHQVARMNPFQRLMYSMAWENGFAPIPVFNFDDLFTVEWPGQRILHIHWVNSVLKNVISDYEARINIQEYIAKIKRLKEAGFKIIWTIHNIVSHNIFLVQQECKLREQLANKVDILHILAENTVEHTKNYYSLPTEKIIYHPHPSYVSSYANFVSKCEARYELGIPQEDIVFLIFGSIQKYKGIEVFIKTFDQYKINNPSAAHIKLIVSGIPTDKKLAENISKNYSEREDVILNLRNVENSEVQYYFNSADWVVCPYGRSLNSGVAFLALSFSKPIIAPHNGGFIDLVNRHQCFGNLYTSESDHSLYQTLDKSIKETKLINNEQIKNDFHIYNSSKVSNNFFKNLRLLSMEWSD